MLPDCGFWSLLPCQLSHPSLVSLFHCSPPELLLRLSKFHPLWGCLLSLSLSLVSEAADAMPGMPPTPSWDTHLLAQGHLANQLGILCQMATQPGDIQPWEPIWVTLSFSLSLPLSLSFSCSSSLFSFLPPKELDSPSSLL
jgi:hypothetical protein